MKLTRRAVLFTPALLSAQQIRANELRRLVVGLSSASLGTAAPRLAKELGLFAQRGLDPNFIIMDSASAATTALIAGSIDLAVSGPGELVIAQARGQDVVVIANTYMGSAVTLVLATSVASKLATPMTASVADRLKALDGMVIASSAATGASTVSFKTATKAVGATMRLTYMAQPAMPTALESGAIQGFIASAPIWAVPVTKGVGVAWISGPNGDLPPENTPAASGHMQAMRRFAENNRELMDRVAAVFTDLALAIDERPAAVKAAVANLYPDLSPGMLDLLFTSESRSWQAKPVTSAEMAHEIAFVRLTGVSSAQIDRLDPATMLFATAPLK